MPDMTKTEITPATEAVMDVNQLLEPDFNTISSSNGALSHFLNGGAVWAELQAESAKGARKLQWHNGGKRLQQAIERIGDREVSLQTVIDHPVEFGLRPELRDLDIIQGWMTELTAFTNACEEKFGTFRVEAWRRIVVNKFLKQGISGSILVVDLQGLHTINAELGNEAGDEALKMMFSLVDGVLTEYSQAEINGLRVIGRRGDEMFAFVPGVKAADLKDKFQQADKQQLKTYFQVGDVTSPNEFDLIISGSLDLIETQKIRAVLKTLDRLAAEGEKLGDGNLRIRLGVALLVAKERRLPFRLLFDVLHWGHKFGNQLMTEEGVGELSPEKLRQTIQELMEDKGIQALWNRVRTGSAKEESE